MPQSAQPSMHQTYEINFIDVTRANAERFPERIAVVHRDRRLTFPEMVGRAELLASLLIDRGFGCFAERDTLDGHQVGQSLVGLYLHNGPEYLEGMLGSFAARTAPFNINYRYVPDELAYILRDARPAALIYHAAFAPTLASALRQIDFPIVLLQVSDESGNELLDGALDYEAALDSVKPQPLPRCSPDDLYVLYTGGTTGMPKGVLWRQADIAVTAMQLVDHKAHREWRSAEEFADGLGRQGRYLLCAPLIHGAAQWAALRALSTGGCVIFPSNPLGFDADDIWDTAEREKATQISIVGDAFASPLVSALQRRTRDLSSIRYLVSGGAPLTPASKTAILEAIPTLRIMETIGSSETGVQGESRIDADGDAADKRFLPGPRTFVVSEDRTHILSPGHLGIGWIASRGRIPLGYLNDRAKSAVAYPIVDGERVSLPGDRARLLPDGRIELLGRDSVTVNSGGEKIFVEEVEAAVRTHPEVVDAVVCGRPSGRWGSEVVAIVVLAGAERDGIGDEIIEVSAARIARYKLPKQVIVVDHIHRSPAGKQDYRWAKEIALTARPPEKPED